MALQLKRGKKETWEKLNPILAYGEPGFVKETGELKIGDGVTAWNNLQNINAEPLIVTANTTNPDDGPIVDIDGATIFEHIKTGRQVLLKFLDFFLSPVSVMTEQLFGVPMVIFKGIIWQKIDERSGQWYEASVGVMENEYALVETREILQDTQTMNTLKLTNN